MSSESGSEWPSELVNKLHSDVDDDEIIQFIEDVVPDDEAHIFDNKREAYVSASDDDKTEKRRAGLAKSFAGLANVHHRSAHRFMFVGFDDAAQFQGIQYLGAEGGDHVYDVDDQEIQNILRDHLEPPPSVEKHRLEADDDRGLVFVIERATSPPIVITETVNAEGDRITTQGIAPTRRSSETTHMRHSDFRDIVEHREEVLTDVLEHWVDDLGRVVGAPAEDIEEHEFSITSDPNAPAVRNVVVPQEARDLNEDLSAKAISWLTDDDLPGSVEVMYKFYNRRDLIDGTEDEYYQNQMDFLFNASLAHYLPGAEWLSTFDGDWDDLFSQVINTDYNHWSILMLEKILFVLGWNEMLQDIADNEGFNYRDSEAETYADMCELPTLERIEECIGTRIYFDGDSYSVSDLYSDEEALEDLFDEVAEHCHTNEPEKGALRSIELIRLSKVGSDRLYSG
ncbi:RNA-binding domain-containing protein [Natrinema halophilum]|uniref:Schlafen AlbA-2 domain-containing protein n=1 Tax=Natrinema halophilum TaxID=1699371 RepID=A0A7D5GK63_9EURY|nr:hypothetical protein [Natrinema halophilum]QLG51007.1 hypothetical protein HYG82_20310 [Natrinema halophilum]